MSSSTNGSNLRMFLFPLSLPAKRLTHVVFGDLGRPLWIDVLDQHDDVYQATAPDVRRCILPIWAACEQCGLRVGMVHAVRHGRDSRRAVRQGCLDGVEEEFIGSLALRIAVPQILCLSGKLDIMVGQI